MTTLAVARESVAGTEARPDNDPVTLHRTMQMMIGDGLREHYQPPQKLSHELFVVLMQLQEEERREKAAKRAPRGSPHDPALSRHAAEVAEHARHVDQAGNDKGDDEHRVHRKTPRRAGAKESPGD
jgi:hypothetical protein